MASSVANDVIMRTGAASAVGARRRTENDVIMTTAGLWRYGDWRHVATGCTAVVHISLGENVHSCRARRRPSRFECSPSLLSIFADDRLETRRRETRTPQTRPRRGHLSTATAAAYRIGVVGIYAHRAVRRRKGLL